MVFIYNLQLNIKLHVHTCIIDCNREFNFCTDCPLGSSFFGSTDFLFRFSSSDESESEDSELNIFDVCKRCVDTTS